MKPNRIGSALRALIFTGLLWAAHSLLATDAPAATGRHTLWHMQGQSNTVHLLGSVHFLQASDYPLATPVETAFSNSAVVVFETDMGRLEDMDTQLKMLEKARLPEGETLEKQLSPETYKAFMDKAAETGLPPMMFDQLKPSMAAITLAMLEFQKMGFKHQYGVDRHFYNLAKKQGKEISGLESVEFQIDLVTGFTKEEGEMMLKSTLKDLDRMKGVVGDMIKAWKTGDERRLAKLLNEAMEEYPAVYKRLVTDRNQRWLPQIQALAHGKKNAIVIVGAGHLAGDDGIVEALRKRGFRVIQQ